MPEEKEMLKRFVRVVTEATRQGIVYSFNLTPVEVTTLHGAVALAMKHPEVREKLGGAYGMLADLRKRLCFLMMSMGFTREEVEWLDKREVS